ncbi:ABC transporter permease [Candidatus Enterococcus murrayae]|uniref:ABC transporter permease n=1 Tax=Candidatus Enterococcus murrayae TaxID=2815321 RepID=A0ABS3HHJ4_9ENTE|nr:ABC transporter permease [Enterococcus sp. MJM16]MBO0452492.1 ABC transporter permease [Enterococcus sp. MJM16]
MYRLFRIIQRDTINLLTNPMWIFFSLMFPFLLVAILGFLTEGLYGKYFTSYDYYGVTLMLFSTMYAATFSANSFMEEKIKKANLRIVYSPIRNWFIPFSKVVATFIFTTLFYTIAAVICHLLFQIRFGDEKLVQIWALFSGMNLLFSCIGVLMCCIFKSEGVANQIISILTAALAMLSGFLFPVANLGETFVKISNWLPTAKVAQTIFEMIYDQNASNFSSMFILLLICSLLILVIATILFNGEEYV